MKKILLIFIVFVSMTTVLKAQKEEVLPFFDKSGRIASQVDEMKSLADTIATVNHRRDDIVWSRIVYRVIDMREKQNSQIYYPLTPTVKYKNLLRIILEAAVNDTLKGYEKKDEDIQPAWDKAPICKERFSEFFIECSVDSAEKTVKPNPCVKKDELTNKPIIDDYQFNPYCKKQLKYVVQEIVFFNRHYSKMYTKILAIAPVYIYNEININKQLAGVMSKSADDIWNFFQSSVVCWFAYDELRPYLAKQLIIPNGNENQRMTFDDFFSQRLYHSYILGDSNMFDKVLLRTYTDAISLRREQQRIENELLNIEQDIWEQ